MQQRFTRAVIAGALALVTQAVLGADFQAPAGDGACPSGFSIVNIDEAYNYRSEACKAIGEKGSARIANGDSMSSYTGGCKIRHKDTSPQPATLCVRMQFQLVSGDNTCPAKTRLATVPEAALFNSQACAALKDNQWYIARLADGGTISGSGYSCAVNMGEAGGAQAKLGNSLCTPVTPSGR